MRERLAGARRVTKVYASGDYSYRNVALRGERWLMAGDAAGFIDPIFSSGVFLAIFSGERAADALIKALATPAQAKTLCPVRTPSGKSHALVSQVRLLLVPTGICRNRSCAARVFPSRSGGQCRSRGKRRPIIRAPLEDLDILCDRCHAASLSDLATFASRSKRFMKWSCRSCVALLIAGCQTTSAVGRFPTASSEKALIRWHRKGSSLFYEAVCARSPTGAVLVRLYKQSPAALARVSPRTPMTTSWPRDGWPAEDGPAPLPACPQSSRLGPPSSRLIESQPSSARAPGNSRPPQREYPTPKRTTNSERSVYQTPKHVK